MAGAAITISLISLVIALSQLRTQERLLAASSWPNLKYSSGNLNEAGEPVITLGVVNGGVGPALLEYVAVSHEGRPVRSTTELLVRCCGFVGEEFDPNTWGMRTRTISNIIMQPGERIDFLTLKRSEATAEVWKRLERERLRLRFDACYCSVLGDCWVSDLRTLRPNPVERCTKPSSPAYTD